MDSFRTMFLAGALALAGCGNTEADVGNFTEADDQVGEALSGPGSAATDARVPELGTDLRVLSQAKLTMAQGLAVAAQQGPVIEAKYELDHDGKLSLSLYPLGKGFAVDAERNVFRELAGDPTTQAFQGSLSVFDDFEHLTRSARDLTLMQLSTRTLASAVQQASAYGTVYWAIPTLRNGRAGYGLYTWNGTRKQYHFYDGRGSRELTWYLQELGTGPGSAATDERVPEMGSDLSILRRSKISMSRAIAQIERNNGPVIEAKFELDHAGKLSLSVYPVGKGVDIDAERNTFFEAAGDPTTATWSPELSEFAVPDAEHLTRSARDLTLVQTSSLTLSETVEWVEDAFPGGIVYWAIPTLRGTRAGYGVYLYGTDGKSHYFFIS